MDTLQSMDSTSLFICIGILLSSALVAWAGDTCTISSGGTTITAFCENNCCGNDCCDDGNLSTTTIAIIVSCVLGFLIICLLVALCIYCWRKRSRERKNRMLNDGESSTSVLNFTSKSSKAVGPDGDMNARYKKTSDVEAPKPPTAARIAKKPFKKKSNTDSLPPEYTERQGHMGNAPYPYYYPGTANTNTPLFIKSTTQDSQ